MVDAAGHHLPVALTLTRLEGPDSATVSAVIHDIGEAQRHRAELRAQARRDPLTGLTNRLGLQEELAAFAQRPVAAGGAVLFLDLDRFKLLNDTFGHAVGDAVLRSVADRLRAAASPGTTVARLGGDEYALLCPDDAAAVAVQRAEQLRLLLAEPIEVPEAGALSVTASVGVRAGPVADPGEWVRDADIAMYAAKRAGRDRAVLFTEAEGQAAVSSQQLRHDLRRATTTAGELVLHYQPVIDLRTGAPVAVEALCRWQHPERGLLSPNVFIPLAEDTGLVRDLGRLVWEEAARQLVEWDAAGWTELEMAVNVSVHQLRDRKFVEAVGAALERHPQLRDRVMVEITESALAEGAMQDTLSALRTTGVTLAIDDFGTGYSALSYLSRFPIDCLKVDKSFLDGLGESPDAHAVLRAVLDLAAALGMSTIAEGIESRTSAALLARAGCDLAQGFYWSRPVPAGEALETLGRLRATAHGFAGAAEQTRARPTGHQVDPGVVARVVQLRGAGASPLTIAAILNREGSRTPDGQRWTEPSVQAVVERVAG